MALPDLACVLTTIQPPTACVLQLAQVLAREAAPLVVIGDRKGPSRFDVPGAHFFSLDQQRELPFRLARQLPVGHYARKNLGYLLAIQTGAACLYETDDDNMPNGAWHRRTAVADVQPVAPRDWLNVYRLYSDENIWPRGFPLDRVTDPRTFVHDRATTTRPVFAPIQQGLAQRAPDVDAVWRLVLDREFHFRSGPSLWLPPGTWCPFNSQTTWWWPAAYPLLYLPSGCSFRLTDIWRGFIAQRCLWAAGHGLVFHAPEVVQERNQHDLMKDFADEVPGYLGNARFVARLADLSLVPGAAAVADNLLCCYQALIGAGFFPARELDLVQAWVDDVRDVMPASSANVRAA